MTDQTDRPAYLGTSLHEAARTIDLPPGDVDAVVRRGSRRVHRRRRGLAGLTVVALVASTVGAVNLLDDEHETSVASVAGLTRGDLGIEWRTVTPSTGLGWANTTASGAGGAGAIYALSTAPGQAAPDANAARVVWRSDDGVEWTAVSTLGSDLYLSDLAAADGRVYAVGTGPATAATEGERTSPLLVGWSDDGARTWERKALPVDLAALSSRTIRVAVGNTAVATGPAGTVVLANLFAALDVPSVLPAGATAPNGWAITDTGVDVLGPERPLPCPDGTVEPPEQKPAPQQGPGELWPSVCLRDDQSPVMVSPQDARGVEASYTWEQLQVDGELLRAVRHQPFAFVAPPGSEQFERVELPAVDEIQGPLMLEAGDTGFDLVTTTTRRSPNEGVLPMGIAMLHSDDGRAWTRSSPLVEDGKWAAVAGRVGGVMTIIGHQAAGPSLMRSNGSGGWTTMPLAAALEDGVPEGLEMYVASAAVGPFGIVAAVDMLSPRSSGSPPDTERHLLVSRDGVTWDDLDLNELAGQRVQGVIRASVVGERAVVAVSVPGRGGGRPEQIVLVGTPT